MTAQTANQPTHVEATRRVAKGIAVTGGTAINRGRRSGAVAQVAFEKADQSTHVIFRGGDVGGGVRPLHRIGRAAARTVVQTNQASDIAAARDAGADVTGVFDGVAFLPTHQAAHVVTAVGGVGDARVGHVDATGGVDGAACARLRDVAVLSPDQAAHVVSANQIAGGGGVGHGCVGGIADQAAHVVAVVHIVHRTDVSCRAGVGHTAATACVTNQTAQVTVAPDDIASCTDIGQAAVVVTYKTTHCAFIALNVRDRAAVVQG